MNAKTLALVIEAARMGLAQAAQNMQNPTEAIAEVAIAISEAKKTLLALQAQEAKAVAPAEVAQP